MPKVRKEVARRELWFRGNLTWKLHKGQKLIEAAYREVKKKLFVLNCSRRFGKSFWLVKLAVECALKCKNKAPRIKIASATIKNLEEFVLPNFEAVLTDCPRELWSGWTTGYVRSKKKFVFPNGAEIQLSGLDKDPDGGRGNYCDLYIVDEAGLVDNLEYLYSSVIAPMTITRPGARIIMGSTPPITPAHSFKKFCDRAKFQKAYVELDVFQNPMMTPENIQDAKDECLTESEWQREYLCMFVKEENMAIVPEWNEANCVKDIPRPDEYKYFDRYVAMDLGTKVDLTAILFGYYDSLKRFVYVEDEDELFGAKMTTPDLEKIVRHKEQLRWPDMGEPYRRVADNNNPLLLQDLGYLHGLHFAATNKDDLHAMVNELRKMVKENRLFVHPRCKRLIGCMDGAVWNKERKAFGRNPTYGHFDHLAALMYLVRNLDQNRDITQLLVTNDPKKQHIRERREQTAMMGAVKRMLGINSKR